ncbi:MAG: hypothetical protein AMS19_00375 [Gemmatimonas sp. SG8_23]|nr:MAG: hypothetical protein AMS19_00375 [Gemmatimonas sp. SG8_23]
MVGPDFEVSASVVTEARPLEDEPVPETSPDPFQVDPERVRCDDVVLRRGDVEALEELLLGELVLRDPDSGDARVKLHRRVLVHRGPDPIEVQELVLDRDPGRPGERLGQGTRVIERATDDVDTRDAGRR